MVTVHVSNLGLLEQYLSTAVNHLEDVTLPATQKVDEFTVNILLHDILIRLECFQLQ